MKRGEKYKLELQALIDMRVAVLNALQTKQTIQQLTKQLNIRKTMLYPALRELMYLKKVSNNAPLTEQVEDMPPPLPTARSLNLVGFVLNRCDAPIVPPDPQSKAAIAAKADIEYLAVAQTFTHAEHAFYLTSMQAEKRKKTANTPKGVRLVELENVPWTIPKPTHKPVYISTAMGMFV